MFTFSPSPTFASPANNDAASDRNSTMSCEALPAEYLLPTPHHHLAAESQNLGHGLSYFLDSTCDSAKSDFGDGDHSTRAEFPSGVEPLVTPICLRGEGHLRVQQVKVVRVQIQLTNLLNLFYRLVKLQK